MKRKSGCGCMTGLGGYDTSDTTETQLYIDNDQELYRHKQAIWKNYLRKCVKGTFDPVLAAKGFQHVTNHANKKYKKDFGEGLTIADRRQAEQDFVAEFMQVSQCTPQIPLAKEHVSKVKYDYGLDGRRIRRSRHGRR